VAVLAGCGLRREEVAGLRWSHLQQRSGRWCFVDVEGKGNKVRTVPVPDWAVKRLVQWKSNNRRQRMPKFNVMVSRTQTIESSWEVTVSAKDAEEARAKVEERISKAAGKGTLKRPAVGRIERRRSV
jgi:integrase